MKISGLADATGVSRATLKYYLRAGLLHPGRATSRTQAEYDDSHVDRVRLIRALTGVGGLSLQNVGRVLHAVDDPETGRLGVMAVAQQALNAGAGGHLSPANAAEVAASKATRRDGTADLATHTEAPSSSSPTAAAPTTDSARAHAWVARRRWRVDPDDPVIHDLDRAWTACEQAGVEMDDSRLDSYADAVETIASVDLDSVPADPRAAVRQVILGTLLTDPVLSSLRRLAQQHTAVTRLSGS